MTVHIAASPDQIAETVLMPGDPLRAKWAADRFLQDPVCVNRTRGMLGYTGTWQGHRVTIHGSGMGMPSMAIYAQELICDFGVRTIIRTGSAGAMQPGIGLRDIVLAQAASVLSMPSQMQFRGLAIAPCADFGLLRVARDAATGQGARVHVGNIYSSDVFYDSRTDLTEALVAHGVLCVEMETAELYAIAARFGVRALAVLTISDHLVTGAAVPAQEREQSFGQMFEIALEAAFSG